MLYRLFDDKVCSDEIRAKNRGVFPVSVEEACFYNKKAWGIFQTINQFTNGQRQMPYLEKILYWAVDLDDGSKAEMLTKIKEGLIPTRIIETKRGFQVWFRALGGTAEAWRAIVVDRLVPFYNADNNARDLCRILRVPGYYHMKNPAEPFLIKEVFSNPAAYTEIEMLSKYPDKGIKKYPSNTSTPYAKGNCKEELSLLSGRPEVNGEVFSFERNACGTEQIYVNGKSTSCWIDEKNTIGSSDGGGPTVVQWLMYYGHSREEAIKILEEIKCQKN